MFSDKLRTTPPVDASKTRAVDLEIPQELPKLVNNKLMAGSVAPVFGDMAKVGIQIFACFGSFLSMLPYGLPSLLLVGIVLDDETDEFEKSN